MAVITRTVAVGVFPTREQAQQAISELKRAGFAESDIGVATRDAENDDLRGHRGESLAGEGAVAGAAAGAGVGALWGLAIVSGLLPAIGPAIMGGTLGALLSSAAAGAAAAGLGGALVGMGVPEEEAGFYEGEFHSGRIVVTVRARDRYDDALRIMHNNGSVDMTNRAATGDRAESTLLPPSTPTKPR